MTNLSSARTLIQADLDHARSVIELWNHQVTDLEKALEQIDAVGTSRAALRVEYQGGQNYPAVLQAPAAEKDIPKRRGRKPKNAATATTSEAASPRSELAGKRGRKLAERSATQAGKVSDARSNGAVKKTRAKKISKSGAAKYKDPNSEKTWAGLGRRPLWMTGDPQRYTVGMGNENAAIQPQAAGTQERAPAGA